ncbi:solute carrier family 12 member 4-like isoform X4 [Pomacea canaliculata]|uniref:solute carrier family 12 member 4-like isoform X4 n=1 Tax=Pomacea canaliculata TaxID=400727 RepID=UPI000D732147|nr:solute carrier family 12 member 4-like isoform X4 [Pomacea canaliculata]
MAPKRGPHSLLSWSSIMAAVRFTVTKSEEEEVPITDSPRVQDGYGSYVGGRLQTPPKGKDYSVILGENSSLSKDHLPLADNEESQFENHMALYEDDLHHQGRISTILSRINAYQGGMQPNMRDVEKSGGQQKKKATLGTVLGVYLPCIQNIFGILLFVRMTWVVGMAGAVEAFFIVGICCCTTLLTSISMSAIATNGVVPAGGSYFMISRSLGPEFGGAVGVLFYLGTSVATSMYIIGAVEILVVYMAPGINLFGDTNSFRLYGTIVLLILAIIVFIGVAFVSKFAAVSLACVTISILCIYIGIFIANEDSSVEVCLLGDRLLTMESVMRNGTMMCTKNVTGPIHDNYCQILNASAGTYVCDSYFNDHNTSILKGIPGLASGVFSKNAMNRYTQQGNVIGTDMHGNPSRGEIVADITTSFMILLGIYFPSCTGIMAGSNRSGDLADAQKSIPVGTIVAIITTSSVYLSSVLFFAGTVEGDLLRDKYGESIGGSLLIGKLAWPHEWLIRIGAFLSTLGAGLQSLTGAPRLLQAIAQDGVIPFLSVFSVTTKRGEPFRALVLTVFIAFIGVCIGVLDYVAPIITMFFLMCYGFVNMACALQTLLRTPNWRPRFRFYHWTLSLVGLALCITLMFISSWYYALAAIAIACCIYKYIEYKGAEQEWGDGIRGLAMSAARYSLLRLQEGPPHTKNWRPQLLVLMKLDASLQPKYPRMVQFANQLKAGKGLTLVCSVLEGKFQERSADALAAKQTLSKMVKEMNIKGFSDVSVATDVTEGICSLVQNAGLGGLRHNTVVMGWPYGWRHSEDEQSYRVFLETVRNVSAAGLALLVTKGINQFPEPDVKLRGTIDVWWIVHDGGLLMLLPFLLTRERPWKHCKLRIFTVAQMEDNSITMKKDLEHYLYQLRIGADVDVIEMSGQDISAYTYERTLMMEQRTQMLRNMRVKKIEPQSIVDRAHHGGNPGAGDQASPQKVHLQLESVPEESSTDPESPAQEHFTFTPAAAQKLKTNHKNVNNKPDHKNVQRMHTAVRLNEHIVEKSHDAQLVILNLPAPPKAPAGDENYMEFLEVLTEGIDRVVMVRGSGREVITIYS